ncbi:DEAD/DEAH box helicase [Nocardioides pocheonensis]|uniref:DEAD/DEAH box helicase n=1 Tax=Nocardioides pocheonensis TaxID=661485 RepID=A0A3N0GJU5_9ACTN|nr:DEAD/DEAH box helicase [Nocardioides pocheonensis]RNM12681.1 DEAD/DEAH box helicase [Nocardioides pocheonensis]
MSFVPLQGPAVLHPADPPRESEIEFSGPQRTIRLPMRGAIPVLTRALRAGDAHASVALLGAATMLAMKLVAAGRLQRSPAGHAWQVGPLLPEDDARVRALAEARAYADLAADDAEETIRALLDAVADTMTRQVSTDGHVPRSMVEARSPAVDPRSPVVEPAETTRPWQRHQVESPDLPAEVVLSLRIEAPDEQLAGGRVIVVPQVHEVDLSTHVVDVEQLWWDDAAGPEVHGGHGFSREARVNAGLALRRAAQAWPVLDRLLRRPVPDRLLLDGDEVADLLEHGLPALAGVGVDVFWPRGLRHELTPLGRVEVKSRTGARGEPLMTGVFGPDSLFEFDWRLALGGDPLTDDEMAALATANGPVIRLRDNWMVIDPATARRAREAVGRRGRRELKPVEALTAMLTGTLATHVPHSDEPTVEVHPGATLEKVRDRIVDAAQVSPLDPPAGLAATLRDYQRHGLTWLAELTGAGLGACLADDMGLGKTVTLIALHLHRRERGLATGPTLVVCPASLLGNWEAEVRRFAPGVPTRRFHASRRDLTGDLGFVFTTYGTMRADHETLAGVAWDLVVADEAQHVKNATSSTARNLRLIPSRCRVALTGTPVENNLTELWAILDWATPGLLGSRNAFRRRWAAPIESGVEPAVARQFAQLVEPFLLRRRKTDPGIAPELPPKTETDQVVALTREQVVLYESLVRESMRRIETADEDGRRGLVLALLTGLKQICNHPAHYLRQASGRIKGRSEKIDVLDELLGTILAEGGSALVFTQYVAMGRLLERHLDEVGIPSLFLHGGTPVPAREQMVATFQAGREAGHGGGAGAGAPPVFLLSLKAGGTGLNLTRADHVIHVDRWWNPAVEDQATDRAYRIGQTRPVQVHRLVTEGTIEQKIGELLARKRSLADAVLGSGETALTELSNDELRELVTLSVGRYAPPRLRRRTPHG